MSQYARNVIHTVNEQAGQKRAQGIAESAIVRSPRLIRVGVGILGPSSL
jgi:hypothetical protein